MFVFQRAHKLPEISYFILGHPGGRLRVGPLELESLPLLPDAAQFDLTLEMAETPAGTVIAAMHYNTDLFDAATVQSFAQHYTQLLMSACASPHEAIGALPILPDALRSETLLRWNATTCVVGAVCVCAYAPRLTVGGGSAGWTCDRTIPELFARVARERAAHVAVTGPDGRSLTYAELHRRSNRLAQQLQRLGAAPEVVVGICPSRSVAMPVAVLAVLKAGACYVPLDPTYPTDRLAYMLSSSGARLVLADDATVTARGARARGTGAGPLTRRRRCRRWRPAARWCGWTKPR
jgi:non-ribosomal peptide synthetase component F